MVPSAIVIIPIQAFQDQLNHLIVNTVGPIGDVFDTKSVVLCIVNEIVDDLTDCQSKQRYYDIAGGAVPKWAYEQQLSYELLAEYGVPVDLAASVQAQIKRSIETMLMSAIGDTGFNKSYCYLSTKTDAVYFYEHDQVIEDYDGYEEIQYRMQLDIDNGDWYPERIRHNFGV